MGSRLTARPAGCAAVRYGCAAESARCWSLLLCCCQCQPGERLAREKLCVRLEKLCVQNEGWKEWISFNRGKLYTYWYYLCPLQ